MFDINLYKDRNNSFGETMAKREDVQSFGREVSNNILVLILIVIIFVSILGTIIVTQAVKDYQKSRQHLAIKNAGSASTTGYVGFTVLPQDFHENAGDGRE